MELPTTRFAFIGVGNMGRAVLTGLIDGHVAKPENITVCGRRSVRSNELREELGVVAADNVADCVRDANIVILAVKPQILPHVLETIQGINDEALFISVAAGIPTSTIENILGHVRVMRAMPNTPATIREAATAICSGHYATERDEDLTTQIFDSIGLTVPVDEEHFDAVTGLSGSGPAYMMLIIESFADAGVKVGLSREIAMKLAVQTIRGSAKLLQTTKAHPGQLKDEVTSPGGTAIAGLHTLEEGGLRTTIINAVEQATNRSRELGRAKPKKTSS